MPAAAMMNRTRTEDSIVSRRIFWKILYFDFTIDKHGQKQGIDRGYDRRLGWRKIPETIPPMMMTGVSMAVEAPQALFRSSLSVALFSFGSSSSWHRCKTMPIRTRPIRKPGRKPPRKSRPTDVPVMLP